MGVELVVEAQLVNRLSVECELISRKSRVLIAP